MKQSIKMLLDSTLFGGLSFYKNQSIFDHEFRQMIPDIMLCYTRISIPVNLNNNSVTI